MMEFDLEKMDTSEENKSFFFGDTAQLRNLIPTESISNGKYDYDQMFIGKTSFSPRVKNSLRRAGVTTISQLLSKNIEELRLIKNLGNKSINEIIDTLPSIIESYARSNEETLNTGHNLIEFYGEEFVSELKKFQPEYTHLIINTFQEYLSESERIIQKNLLLSYIPQERRDLLAMGFIRAYNRDQYELLASLCKNSYTLQEFIESIMKMNYSQNQTLTKFCQWCNFDVDEELDQFLNALNLKAIKIISLRSKGYTLDEIGKRVLVTRERVRQIISKTTTRFSNRNKKMIYKISALKNGVEILTLEDIESVLLNSKEEKIFLLKNCSDSNNIRYDSKHETFILSNEDSFKKLNEFVSKLPSVFSQDVLDDLLIQEELLIRLQPQLIKAAVVKEFKLTGNTYHRGRMSRTYMFSEVLRKYYPTGLWAYNESVLNDFRNRVYQEFGNVKLPENNRALSARIINIGVLYQRGTYVAKKESYITNGLLTKIQKFIDNSNEEIFLMNTIFKLFEKDLKKEGVDNKYYLQGIIKETLGEKYYISRDYLSKNEKITSIDREIVSFIEKSDHPISKLEIKKRFPGITDIVLSLAVSNKQILNLFGEYLHVSQLKIFPSELVILQSSIDHILSDYQAHHCRDIFDCLYNRNDFMLKRNGIFTQVGLYSLLAHLFTGKYQFSRPYIALKGVRVEHPEEQISMLVKSSGKVPVTEIFRIASENHYQINSMLKYLNKFSDTHLFDGENLVKIENTGIDEAIFCRLENLITSELIDCIPIQNMNCITSLPRISIPWTEWLIYSSVLKWSNKLEVGTTSNQLRLSVPIIGYNGTITNEALAKFSDINFTNLKVPLSNDDLDDFELDDFELDDFELDNFELDNFELN